MRRPVIEWISDEQASFYEAVCEFAESLPRDVSRHDREQTFDRASWDRCAEFGIHGLPASREYGGRAADTITMMLALEALGYGCADGGLLFAMNVHLWTGVVPVSVHGTEAQKKRWLPGLCDGSIIGCHALTEPDAGSDVFAMRATAAEVSGGYCLNGRKAFVTNASHAGLLTVFARSAQGIGSFGITAFLVSANSSGLNVSAPVDKLGLRTAAMSEITLDDVYVSAEDVLGVPGRAGEVFQTSMRWERSCIMASQVGTMRRIMEQCVTYARSRQQFGKPISKFESVSTKIANMQISINASRALLLRAGWLADHGFDTMLEAAVAKTFVSEASVQVGLDAIQIHGGNGYLEGFEVERMLRDSIGSKIYSGTSEIQRQIIARGLGL